MCGCEWPTGGSSVGGSVNAADGSVAPNRCRAVASIEDALLLRATTLTATRPPSGEAAAKIRPDPPSPIRLSSVSVERSEIILKSTAGVSINNVIVSSCHRE